MSHLRHAGHVAAAEPRHLGERGSQRASATWRSLGSEDRGHRRRSRLHEERRGADTCTGSRKGGDVNLQPPTKYPSQSLKGALTSVMTHSETATSTQLRQPRAVYVTITFGYNFIFHSPR